MRFTSSIAAILATLALAMAVAGQQTNPVERQIANPITDTPNINPIAAQQKIAAPKPKKKPSVEPEGGDGEVVVYSDKMSVEGDKDKRVVRHAGNVDVRYGIYRMQADEITIYEVDNRLVAKGSVIFDQGDDQRITGSTATWNYRTKLGWRIVKSFLANCIRVE